MIKNIIFDFGGVLIDLDTTRTGVALEAMTKIPAAEIYSKHKELFDNYEKGETITENFMWNIQNLCDKVPQGFEIIQAWNAMIVGWNPAKLVFIEEVKKKYKTYLLSNTNELHIDYVRRDLVRNHQIEDFETKFFTKAYYSYEIKMRKPDLEIYNYVIKDAQINPSESLFIDDNLDNILAAREVGLFAYHHPANDMIDLDKIIASIEEPSDC
jgi:glucose-1-phosphatase